MDSAVQAQLVVRAFWDPDARVWIAESDDIIGLTMEHKNLDALIEEMKELAPDLMDLNGQGHLKHLPIHVLADRIVS